MVIQDLQNFLESSSVEGGAVSVDLLRISRILLQRQQQAPVKRNKYNKLKLVLDAECCLDRLYGGYFSDWACGGQWNRTVQFLSLLMNAMKSGNIELAVYFNGALEPQRMGEWIAEQQKIRQRMNMVLKHINTKGTPPPKVWWCPPTCLRTALRMGLRHLNTVVMCSMDDHHQEVIAYCRENGFHGLMADDAEYTAFDPPRYFSSENLKLTYRGSLETKEFMIAELCKTLSLSPSQLCILAALLGTHHLSEDDLQDIYASAGVVTTSKEQLVRSLAEYILKLPATTDMDGLVSKVAAGSEDREKKFREAVQYYLNGTKDGFLKYRTATARKRHQVSNSTTSSTVTPSTTTNSARSEDQDLDTSGFASETTEREQKSLEDYKVATAKAITIQPDIVVDEEKPLEKVATANGALLSCSTSGASSMATSPRHLGVLPPRVSADVMRTATERHQKGLMSPLIYHALVSNQVRLQPVMEDEAHREFPAAHLIFRPVRQKVYAILFNLHHLHYLAKKTQAQVPEVVIREWIYTHGNQYREPVATAATALPWAVPTIQRLWFGSTVDDKRRRLRAFVTCLGSDSSLMLNPSYVPQHMLILACVLRYVMMDKHAVLRKQELDAFIAQAFSNELMNSQFLQDLTLPLVTSRGVQLASLFMHGVETALLANDACGAPIPWLMSCPWLYFDGKLFHHTLARAAVVKNLLELCENHIERVVKVERMRKAILEGLEVQFAKAAPTPLMSPLPNCLPPVALPSSRGPLGRLPRRPLARGGQLQVAGVVVGQWGANYSYAYGRGRGNPHPHPPQLNRHQVVAYNPQKKAPQSKRKPQKGNPNANAKGKGRGITVQLQSGDTVLGAEEEEQEHKGQGDGIDTPTLN